MVDHSRLNLAKLSSEVRVNYWRNLYLAEYKTVNLAKTFSEMHVVDLRNVYLAKSIYGESQAWALDAQALEPGPWRPWGLDHRARPWSLGSRAWALSPGP